MARIQVRFLPTGETGTIPEQEFDPTIYQRLDNQESGNIVIDMLTSLSRPFVQPLERTGAAIESLGLLASSPEFRKQRRGAELSPDEARTLASFKPMFRPTSQERGEVVEETGRNLAGLAAFGVPFGKGASLTSRALIPGAATGGLFALSEPEAGLGEAATGAATGAVTAGVLDKLLGAGKASREAGEALRQGVVNPKVPATPFAAADEKAIAKGLQKAGLKGSAASQKAQMPALMKNLTNQIDDVLRTSKATEKSSVIKKAIQNHLDDSLQFVPDDPLYQKTADRLTKRIPNGNVHVSALFKFKKYLNSQLKNAFRKVAGDLNSPLNPREEVGLVVLDKVDDIITKMEPAVKDLTLQQSALFKGAPGVVQQAGQKYRLPLLNIGVSTQPVQAAQDMAGRGLVSTGSLLDRVLAPAGAIPPQIPVAAASSLVAGNGAPQGQEFTRDNQITNNLVDQGVLPQNQREIFPQQGQDVGQSSQFYQDPQTGQYVSNDNQWVWNQQDNQWVPNQQAQQIQQGNIPSEEAFKMAILNDLTTTDGKNLSKLNTAMKIFHPQSTMSAQERSSIAQAESALRLVDVIDQNYQLVQQQGLTARGAGLGRLGGVSGSLATISQSSPEAASYMATRDAFLSQLARASGERGVLTDTDVARIRRALPSFYDTPETAARNIETIRQIIGAAIQRKQNDTVPQDTLQETFL